MISGTLGVTLSVPIRPLYSPLSPFIGLLTKSAEHASDHGSFEIFQKPGALLQTPNSTALALKENPQKGPPRFAETAIEFLLESALNLPCINHPNLFNGVLELPIKGPPTHEHRGSWEVICTCPRPLDHIGILSIPKGSLARPIRSNGPEWSSIGPS